MSRPAPERPGDALPTPDDFAGWPALGGLSLRAAAGPVAFDLARIDARIRTALAPLEHPSACAEPRLDVRLEWTRAERPAWLALAPGDRARSACWEESGAMVWATHHAALLMDADAERGVVVLTDQDADEAARSAQNVLRVAVAWRLARAARGLLLHAAAVLDGSEAVIFLGPSGAGKTTAARLSAPRAILADDACVVTLGPEGLLLHPGIFWADPALSTDLPADPVGVKAIYRLKQAPASRVRALPRAAGAASLLAHAPFLSGLEARLAGGGLAERLAGATRVAELELARDPRFWQTIDDDIPVGDQ